MRLVRELHRLGIHHGDLQPRNIAVAAPSGEPIRLFDFSESCPTKPTCRVTRCGEIVHFDRNCLDDGTGMDYDERLARYDGAEPRDQSVAHETPPF